MTTKRVKMPTDPVRRAAVLEAIADEAAWREAHPDIDPTAAPRYTHLLHVVGRNIARETGIQPTPVAFRGTGDRIVEDVMLAIVRRCFRHRPDLEFDVEWTPSGHAVVWVLNRAAGRAEVAAHFRLTPITADDVARVGAPAQKELLP